MLNKNSFKLITKQIQFCKINHWFYSNITTTHFTMLLMRIGEHNTLCSGRTHSAFELNTSCSLLVHYDNGQTSLRWELNSPIAMCCSWLRIPLKFLSSIKSASERETKHFVAMGNIADPSALCYRQTVWSAALSWIKYFN